MDGSAYLGRGGCLGMWFDTARRRLWAGSPRTGWVRLGGCAEDCFPDSAGSVQVLPLPQERGKNGVSSKGLTPRTCRRRRRRPFLEAKQEAAPLGREGYAKVSRGRGSKSGRDSGDEGRSAKVSQERDEEAAAPWRTRGVLRRSPEGEGYERPQIRGPRAFCKGLHRERENVRRPQGLGRLRWRGGRWIRMGCSFRAWDDVRAQCRCSPEARSTIEADGWRRSAPGGSVIANIPGLFGAWRRLVGRIVRSGEVGGSNPLAQTTASGGSPASLSHGPRTSGLPHHMPSPTCLVDSSGHGPGNMVEPYAGGSVTAR